MKKLFALGLIAFLLTACGKSGGGSGNDNPETGHSCQTLEAIGLWENTADTSQTLEVYNTCEAYGSYCEHDLSFSLPNETTGETVLTVHSANLNAGCMQPGDYACVVGVNSTDNLIIDCGTTNQFIFQRGE